MKKAILILILLASFRLSSQSISPTTSINNKHLTETAKNNSIDSLIQLCTSKINPDSIKATMQRLQDFGTRFSLAPNHKEVALWLQNKFISMGYNTVLDSFELITHCTLAFFHDTNTYITMQYNVVATKQGSVNPDKEYIIGGHYDSYSTNNPLVYAPGADDDASGVAAAIEIARVMKKINYNSESTIKFIAFAAEEGRYHTNLFGGSEHSAIDAVNNHENIGFMLTNDMIANNPTDTVWKLKINYNDNSGWIVQLADDICLSYTNLTPVHIYNTIGADDHTYWQVGYNTLYMCENEELTPINHSDADTVGNCNLAYCAEITKVSAGMLIKASESPANIKNLFIVNPGDGHTLKPTWNRNLEGNLAGYKVHIGRAPNIYDSVITITDTFYVFNNLLNDTMYYIGVSAINSKGIESCTITEKSDVPGFALLNEGILIIKDSKLGIQISSEQQLDDFYNEMCDGFNHSQYDAATANKISLNVIGKYSSLIWYVNKKGWTTSILPQYHDLLRNYLNLGGHILFTLYQPSIIMENNTLNKADFRKGSFIYDCANIAHSQDTSTTRFSGAIPVSSSSNSLAVDSLKIPAPNYYHYQLPFIEAIYPSEYGNAIYLYNSGFDSTNIAGEYINKPVGVENLGPEKNVVTLSFPLYYIKADQAKVFVHQVMADKFHENYTGIDEANNAKNSGINIYPNPVNDQVTVTFAEKKADQLILYNMCGSIMYQEFNITSNSWTIDLSKLPKGVYVLKAINGKNVEIRKIIKA